MTEYTDKMNMSTHESSSEKTKTELKSPKRNISVMGYITSELTRGYFLERDKAKFSERRERVYTFMKTPRELEKFVVFGFFQCMDAFLFLFTFLPIRILLASFKILTQPCGILTPRCLEPAHVCDMLKGVILLASLIIVNYIDTSMMYHLVRGQAVIKLYVFFNMLEIADRMFSSFGQDILDALFWTATEPKGRKREHVGVIPHLILAIIYVVIHALLILFQATVLNVAFNSHNKALLTIMMSNNFIEIKGSLFRKIDNKFLYHIACSDVKERFHYIILLGVVFIRNMNEFSWNMDHVWVIIPDAVLVFIAEILVDWVKHAFILKFNEIPADIYCTFSVRLAEEVIANRQSRAVIDYSDMIARRMSFTPIPLAVLTLRICTKSFKVSGNAGFMVIVMLYLCLLTFKIFNSICILGKTYNLIDSNKDPSKHSNKSESKKEETNTESNQSTDSFQPESWQQKVDQSERHSSFQCSSSFDDVGSFTELYKINSGMQPNLFSSVEDPDRYSVMTDYECVEKSSIQDLDIPDQVSSSLQIKLSESDYTEHSDVRHRLLHSQSRESDVISNCDSNVNAEENVDKTRHISTESTV